MPTSPTHTAQTPAPPSPAPAAAGPLDARQRFLAFWRDQATGRPPAGGAWQSLVLSKYRGGEPNLRQLIVKPVQLRGEPHLSFVWRHATRDVTKNLPPDEGASAVEKLLAHDFQHAHLRTEDETHQLSISKKGKSHWARRAGAGHDDDGTGGSAGDGDPIDAHDRAKRRYLELDRPWLTALGVTDDQRRLVPAMSRKWKQINKFVEVFSHAFDNSPLAGRGRLEVVDFGAGKGYLTFALHDFLRNQRGLDARVTGVELRGDLVRLCNEAIERCALQGLAFSEGDVRSRPPQAVDVMIALHACDIATDYAIHTGIRAGAAVIMCSPCCHKQVRPQLLSPHPLRPILQHGIHLGQEAEMLTDGLRALLLEASGYATQVFEFVSLEHTSKNKMILAVKRASPPSPAQTEEVWRQVAEIKAFYGIREQCLETLLKEQAPVGAISSA